MYMSLLQTFKSTCLSLIFGKFKRFNLPVEVILAGRNTFYKSHLMVAKIIAWNATWPKKKPTVFTNASIAGYFNFVKLWYEYFWVSHTNRPIIMSPVVWGGWFYYFEPNCIPLCVWYLHARTLLDWYGLACFLLKRSILWFYY